MSSIRKRFNLSIRLTLGVGIMLLAIFGTTMMLSFRFAKQGTSIALERQGDAIASTLNHTFEVLVAEGALVQLQRVTTNTLFLPDVHRVTVVDKSGKVLASTNRREIGKLTNSERLKQKLSEEEFLASSEYVGDDLIFIRPLFSGHYTSGTDTGLVGAIEVALDRRAVQSSFDETVTGLLGIQFGGYAVVALVMALALRALVAKPLHQLYDAAEKVRAGNRSARSLIRTHDEIGVVSEAFDALTEEVEQTLATLESKVKARTRSLRKEVVAKEKALGDLERANAETNRANEELRSANRIIEESLAEKNRINRELIHAKDIAEQALVEKIRVNEELARANRSVELALVEKNSANEQLVQAKLDLEQALEHSLSTNEALSRAKRDVEDAHAELISSVAERLRLADTIRELSTPIMRVYRGILAMPLIGKIDDARAREIEAKLLAGIQYHDAREVIMDLSGVPFVDTNVARGLIRARRSAELIGTKVTLVGLRGDVAKSIVSAGLDLSGTTTLRDLESALLRALSHAGLEVRRVRSPARA